MAESSGVGVLAAFFAGVVSFLSPCVLPLVPGYVSFIADKSLQEVRATSSWRTTSSAIALSLFFVSGFSLVFIALGASASAIGRLLLAYRYEANIVGGIVVITFGLFMVGLFKAPWFYRDVRFYGPRRGGRPIAAFGMGLAFSFGWTPCIGPILGAILTVSAVSTDEFNGMILLGIYSLGLGVPFLLAAAFTDTFLRRVKGIRLAGRTIQAISGCILIVMGVAMITGYLSMFAFWLLKTFPVLSTIG